MREICEYLTKQFFDYISIQSYRDGIPLIDVKEVIKRFYSTNYYFHIGVIEWSFVKAVILFCNTFC